MELNILTLCYLLASVTFIVGLKMLSHPASARKGNLVAAAGMSIAILGTIFLYKDSEGHGLHNHAWIFAGLLIGGVIGTLAAKKVKMTAMPEMVSLFNGMGGACAALISIVEFNHLVHGFTAETYAAGGFTFFEQLDKITPAKTPLALEKKLFREDNTPTGPVLTPIVNNSSLKTGDKVVVRIVLRVDRDMEFVHMKDLRAAAFEPQGTLSGYRYQGGLGYYEAPRDASMNFYFDDLRKGTYVFEYSLKATQKGDFSNGITTIQCQYAPEFSARSEGIRVVVE